MKQESIRPVGTIPSAIQQGDPRSERRIPDPRQHPSEGELFRAIIGIEPAWIKSYQEHFVTINPWLAGHPFRRRVVAIGEQILNDRELVRTEFYNDCLRPKDWFYCCGVMTGPASGFLQVVASAMPRCSLARKPISLMHRRTADT